MIVQESHMNSVTSFCKPFGSPSVQRRGKWRGRVRHRINAVSKSDLDELEMHIAIASQKMSTAAKEDKFKEAAQLRDRLEDLRLKHRLLQVKHTEGQVIQHRKYNYMGVIFGVHAACQADEGWIRHMRVEKLPLGAHQPFYHVLVDNRYRVGDAVTYVAQENIVLPEQELEGEDPIQHRLVGQFFEGFDRDLKRYKPSQRVIEQYPDSLEARKQENDGK